MKTLFSLVLLLTSFSYGTVDCLIKDIAQWKHKDNVSLQSTATGIRADISVDKFDFGWFRIPLPVCDYSKIHGIHLRTRIAEGHSGNIQLNMVLFRSPIRYFGKSLGTIASFGTASQELYLPITETRENGNNDAILTGGMLANGDDIQLIISNLQSKTSLELTQLELVMKDDPSDDLERLSGLGVRRMLRYDGKTEHPRLLLHGTNLEKIRSKAHSGGKEQIGYETLILWADVYMKTFNEKAPFAPILSFRNSSTQTAQKNQIAFEGLFNPLVYPIEPLAAAGLITGNEAYSRKAATGLVNMARSLTIHSPQINYGFFYTRTFYVRALALGYDWLYAFLTPEERRDIQATLLGFVLDIYEKSFQQHWGKHPLQRVWNWDPGLASCVGLGMLALEGETTAPENAIIFQMRRHVKDYLSLGIDQDGACLEGPSYINYGLGAGTLFMEILRQQGRGDLFTETNAQLIAPWLAYEMLPGKKSWNNLCDCGFGTPPAGQFYIYVMGRYAELAKQEQDYSGIDKLLPQEGFTSGLDYLQHFPEAPGRRMLSYRKLASIMAWNMQSGALGDNPELMSAQMALVHALTFHDYPMLQSPESCLTPSRLFRGRGLVVSRDGFGPESLHLEIEAGPHTAGHDQADKGSFTFRAYGQDFFIDSGYGNDCDPQKSSGPFAHNLVLADGEGQPCRAHNNSSGNITGYMHTDSFDWIRVDALEAWNQTLQHDFTAIPTGRNIQRAIRQFVLVRSQNADVPPYLVVYDDICKADDAQHDFTWLWHYASNMNLSQTGHTWELAPSKDCPQILTSTSEHTNCSAVFPFTAPADGDYKLVGLTAAMGQTTGKSDSFSLSINQQEINSWDIKPTSNLTWNEVKERGSLDAYRITAKAKETITVILKVREPDAALAKLALIPYQATLPMGPTHVPSTGQTLATLDAQQGVIPFIQQEYRQPAASEALVTVFPVGTPHGTTTTSWFETSHDGAHPRLEHTVSQTANPHFLMVIVPRRNANVQLPVVQKLAEAALLVTWHNRTDRIDLSSASPRIQVSMTEK